MDLGVLFGLGSAAAFGAGDFSGGLASRRVSGLTVAGLAQAIGLVALLFLLAALHPAPPSTGALAVAALAGACGGLGLVALYAGLSLGSMGVVAALSGVGSVALPLLISYLLGRAPVSPAQWLGVVVTMAAVGAASGATRRGVEPRAVMLGIVAAVFFGLWFLLLDVAAEESGSEAWALVASRGAATVLIGGAALIRGRYAGLRGAWPNVLLARHPGRDRQRRLRAGAQHPAGGRGRRPGGHLPHRHHAPCPGRAPGIPAPAGHRGRGAGGGRGSRSSRCRLSVRRAIRPGGRPVLRDGVRRLYHRSISGLACAFVQRASRRRAPRSLPPYYRRLTSPMKPRIMICLHMDVPSYSAAHDLRPRPHRRARRSTTYQLGAADAAFQSLGPDAPIREGSGLSARKAIELFEDQVTSRASTSPPAS